MKNLFMDKELIAHGGGEINDKARSNSIEAIDRTLKYGMTFIELDVWIGDEKGILFTHNITKIKKEHNPIIIDGQKWYGKNRWYTMPEAEYVRNLAIGDVWFLLDIKNPSRHAYQTLRNYFAGSNYILEYWSLKDALHFADKIVPGMVVVHKGNLNDVISKIKKIEDKGLFLAIDKKVYNKIKVKITNFKNPIYVWTVNKNDRWDDSDYKGGYITNDLYK